MLNPQADHSIPLIDLLYKLSGKIGAPQLIKHLKKIDSEVIEQTDEKLISAIIQHVASYYNVSPDYFINRKRYSRDETRYWGVIYICVLLAKKTRLNKLQIGQIFGLSYSSVREKINEFHRLERPNKIDFEKITAFEVISSKLDKSIEKPETHVKERQKEKQATRKAG